jgi:hypothetical protein
VLTPIPQYQLVEGLGVLAQFIASYNAKLERYGTPVPKPAVELIGSVIRP